MKLSNKYYGYPVLMPFSDDFEGYLKSSVNVYVNNETNCFDFKVTVELSNDDLLLLITEKKASICLHIEESKTCFRKIYQFNEKTFLFSIPFGTVKEELEFNTFILTNEKIYNFKATKIHTFYRDIEINYEPFQIIGAAHSSKININREPDEIKDSASIFSIISDKNAKDNIINYELTEERILIKMPDRDFNLYGNLYKQNQLKNRHKDILLSTIAIPVMTAVFNELKESGGIYEDKIWYKSIKQSFKEKKINFEEELKKENISSYELSQIIFGGVVSKSLYQIEKLTEEIR